MPLPPQLDDLPPALARELRAAYLAIPANDTPQARAAAWGRLGMLLHAQRLRQLARAAYGRALADFDDPRWHYLRGVAFAEDGDIERSIAHFDQVVAAQPDNFAAWYRLGVAALIGGDLPRAAAALGKARVLQPEAAVVLAALADLATARGDHDEARALLLRAWQREPQAGQLAYKLAMAERRRGDLAAAAQWLERQPDNSLAPNIDDPLLLEVANLSRSARFFEAAAEWHLARGDQAAAAEALRSATALAPEDAALASRLVGLLANAGRTEEALAEARRAVALDDNSARAWYLLAWLGRRAEDAPGRLAAARAAERSLVLAEDSRARSLAAALAMRDGRYAVAVDHYRALLDSTPDSTPAEPAYYQFRLGLSHLAAGGCEAALGPLAEATRRRGDWGEAHLALARAEALCGNAADAVARSEALLRAKDDADVRLTLAFAALAAGRRAEAKTRAEAELPHPDAALLLDAIAAGERPAPFHAASSWWLPEEVR